MQTKLLEEALEVDFGIQNPRIAEYYEIRRDLKNFLSTFGNRHIKDIDIENIFTILDRAYTSEENFQKHDVTELLNLRSGLIDLIIATIDYHQQQELPNAYNKFAEHLFATRSSSDDKVSVLSLNWDTLLEKSLLDLKIDKLKVDYCFYNYGLSDEFIPHITLKALGYSNIKILKLHGSINWLYCSNCGRMYVDESINIGTKKEECTYCKKYSLMPSSQYSYGLHPFIVTPTLLKKFDNLHIKYSWQNTFVELQEADNVVFIGYSLPKADYEFMYLLKKAINDDKKITVVLASSDEHGDENCSAPKRYKALFGDKIEFYFNGFENWINQCLTQKSWR
jgi:NAD-dependent SIR2 family protein deacetylase